ncbi:hypothetical protein [Cellulomonas cellasea]|uniref:Uncharacterized protein n=2 Tax=Cellulomonas cellasea TaxID=43670 RepID=A0A0A0B9J0_9CELL|nr:hypothetical protein [Cellulomonas cellasea]KGM03530.1 hypothetical protein Q760_02485 [Cellulomonas cellasea DSM 20118]GEA87137.1 hypothetical protein CCE01nite_10860 [Cellulomonas cellasea]
MDGATRTESTTDERTPGLTSERTDERSHDLTEGILAPDEVGRLDPADETRPLVRHGSDLLDLVAGGVPFAVAHDVRASAPRPPQPTEG